MIRHHIFTWLREETVPVRAGAFGELLFARRTAEICCRAADIVNIAFKFFFLYHLPCFRQNGFVTSCLHNTSLMECQCTEAAGTKTAAVACQAVFDFPKRRHAAVFFIAWVVGTHIRKGIDIIHLLLRQRAGRRILYDITLSFIRLRHRLRIDGISIFILDCKAFSIRALALPHLFKRRQHYRIDQVIQRFAPVNGARNKSDIMNIDSCSKGISNRYDRKFSHSVRNQIRTRIEKNGAAYLAGPVIVMCQTAERCLDAAEDHRCMFIRSPDQIAVHGNRAVRPFSHHAARCKSIDFSVLFRHSIMIDHGIHISGGDKKAKTRFTENRNAVLVLPVRLGDDADGIAVRLKHAADDRRAERGMVHVGISDDIDKVKLFDSPFLHLFSCNW